jgi:hypothetical protein
LAREQLLRSGGKLMQDIESVSVEVRVDEGEWGDSAG